VRLAFALVLTAVLASIACGSVIARKYEYEEEVFLGLDGSATVYINASVPALVALRGVALSVDPRARLDRQVVRAFYETPVSDVASVTVSRREGRRYVHLRISVPDVRRLGESPLFSWSSYGYTQQEGQYEFVQTMRAAAGQNVGNVGWDGSELVAIRLHLPSKVTFHNSPSRTIERGNIIVWEQNLADRLKSVPLEVVARMETQSILFRTLALFGAMAVLAAATMAGFIWFVKTRAPGPGHPAP
jgi:hypothetical protein